jgi:vanillate O-demethylase ferredoxin subunit
MNHAETVQVRVKSITWEADGILSFDLRPMPPRRELPPFTAGAHVDVHLANGLIRSYSLLNAQDERHRYVIGVNRDASSRGGSRFMHDSVKAGDALTLAVPRNNFALEEQAPLSVFIAGGIGITPLSSMIARLQALGRPWRLHYAARTRQNAAFVDALQALRDRGGGEVHFSFDREPGGRMLDIPGIVAALPPDAHIYCCGPLPMLDAFESATRQLPAERVHVEYFAAREAAANAGGYTVELARSRRTIAIQPGHTILDSLEEAGVDAAYSCREGVCGTCEVRVIDGIPDHRDLVLSAADKARNDRMMICCSGAKSPRLVIDL